jgi:hypothetical protein
MSTVLFVDSGVPFSVATEVVVITVRRGAPERYAVASHVCFASS